MDTFAEVLTELILEKGLSLRKLQEKSGVSATQLGKYLKGAYPTVEVCVRLADYFNCSIDYLFGLAEQRNYGERKALSLEGFVDRYKALLKQNNITHYKFAKSVNLSESCLRHWKYGQTPKIESLVLIVDKLGGSIDALLGLV